MSSTTRQVLLSLSWPAAIAVGFLAGYQYRGNSRSENATPASTPSSASTSAALSNRDITPSDHSLASPSDTSLRAALMNLATPPGQTRLTVPLEVPGVSTRRITEFTEILTLSSASDRRQRFAALLPSLTKAEAITMRRLFHNLSANGNNFDTEWRDFWHRWGEIDPLSALEDTSHANPADGWARDCARNTLIGWAGTDPNAASDWLNNNRDNPLFEAAFRGFMVGLGNRDLNSATATAISSTKPGDPLLGSAMEQLAEIAVARGQLTGLTQWFDQLPADTGEGSARRMAVDHVWWRLQRSGNVEQTAAWMTSTASQPWRNDKYLAETARKYAERSPADAMEWASALPPSPTDGHLTGIDQVARRWARQDLNAFTEWVASSANGAATDQARSAYAIELQKTDPVNAEKWVTQIKDDKIRQETLATMQKKPSSTAN